MKTPIGSVCRQGKISEQNGIVSADDLGGDGEAPSQVAIDALQYFFCLRLAEHLEISAGCSKIAEPAHIQRAQLERQADIIRQQLVPAEQVPALQSGFDDALHVRQLFGRPLPFYIRGRHQESLGFG